MQISLPKDRLIKFKEYISAAISERTVIYISLLLCVAATLYSYLNNWVILYGDAESHLNIGKRVIDSITPGFAQLGGVWLPIPHLLLIPFVYFNFLWRTGLAGSIVSGIAYIVTSVFIYKFVKLLTGNKAASFLSFLVFALNPNVLYLQSTPMTELTMIAFFVLSSYYFARYVFDQNDLLSLLYGAFCGFASALSRYDGWFLVFFEAVILVLLYLPQRELRKKMQGTLILYCTLAFAGILMWLGWDYLILGDPLYFTHSQFSAKYQQLGWLARGQLPGYHNILQSFLYYFFTAMSNAGVLIFSLALVGFIAYVCLSKGIKKWYITALLLVPFVFYVATLFIGQSVIFVPSLTPATFEWKLFNVRYGVMMMPFVAVFLGYLFYKARRASKAVIASVFVLQFALFGVGFSKVVSFEDGRVGLSAQKNPDAQQWMAKHYDKGLVLLDDYTRTLSVIKSNIPMENLIYIGNKPYWEESLRDPDRYATWIIMQKDDAVWKGIYDRPEIQGQLYKYFVKVYTSPESLIFQRRSDAEQS